MSEAKSARINLRLNPEALEKSGWPQACSSRT